MQRQTNAIIGGENKQRLSNSGAHLEATRHKVFNAKHEQPALLPPHRRMKKYVPSYDKISTLANRGVYTRCLQYLKGELGCGVSPPVIFGGNRVHRELVLGYGDLQRNFPGLSGENITSAAAYRRMGLGQISGWGLCTQGVQKAIHCIKARRTGAVPSLECHAFCLLCERRLDGTVVGIRVRVQHTFDEYTIMHGGAGSRGSRTNPFIHIQP